MTLAFQVIRVDVPSATGRRSLYWESREFAREPIRATVALAGFRLQYDGTDHHVKVHEVDVDFVGIVTNPTNLVIFRVECNLADKNGDDAFSGYVDVLVIGDLPDEPGLRLPRPEAVGAQELAVEAILEPAGEE